jgi:hypothetical protein
LLWQSRWLRECKVARQDSDMSVLPVLVDTLLLRLVLRPGVVLLVLLAQAQMVCRPCQPALQVVVLLSAPLIYQHTHSLRMG